MAVIIQCAECHKRPITELDPCPACGSDRHVFVLDYMFDGRHSKRLRQVLPDSVNSMDAALKIEEIRRQLKKRKSKIVIPSGATVKDLFSQYLVWCKEHRSITTHDDIKKTYYAHFERIMGNEIVCRFGTENYDYYQTVRLADKKRNSKGPVKNRTINKELNYFSGFLKWCRVHRKINIEHFIHEALPAPRRKPIVLTIEEIVRIIREAKEDPFYYALILSIYTLGLRYSGVVNLTLKNFDFKSKIMRTIQKGDKEIILPIDDILIKAIKAMGITDPDEYLFRDRRKKITPEFPHGRPIKNIRLTLAKICERAAIQKPVTPHTFRHTWATHMLIAGVNLRTIQKYLDHEEVTTTELYTHLDVENLRTGQAAVMNILKNKIKSQRKT